MKKYDMQINVVTVGDWEDEQEEAISRKIDALLVELKARANDSNTEENGYTGRKPRLRFIAESRLSGDGWEKIARNNGVEFSRVSINNVLWSEEWIVDKADIIFAVWNETSISWDGAVREVMFTARQRQIPCVWVSKKNENSVYWSKTSYFEEYSSTTMRDFCRQLLTMQTEEPIPAMDKRIPLFNAGKKLYNHFLLKYKAKVQNVPFEEDMMLSDNLYFKENHEAETSRLKLLDYFRTYDTRAGLYGDYYRTGIYLRSVLPLAATVFISVGFYIETVLGKPVPMVLGGLNLWSVIAGIGFFFHALVNLYVFFLSGNEKVKQWNTGFRYNRSMAEAIRILIHCVPYGVAVNIHGAFNQGSTQQSGKIYSRLRSILCECSVPDISKFSQEDARGMLNGIRQLLSDQMAYQKRTADRYELIVKQLKRMGTVLFYIGFVLVVLRGFMQLFIVFAKLDSNVTGYARSFANMLALMAPAWASYFTGKLTLGGYEKLRDESSLMTGKLQQAEVMVDDILARNEISIDMVKAAADEISILMLSEVADWEKKTETRQITKL